MCRCSAACQLGLPGLAARARGGVARQQAGRVEREELSYLKVAFLLKAAAAAPRANASVVLVTPMLWTRYGPEGVRVHAEGPAPGDAVVVTEASVVKAIVEERLTMADALAGGMLRIYPPQR